jgi:hypothetical protein
MSQFSSKLYTRPPIKNRGLMFDSLLGFVSLPLFATILKLKIGVNPDPVNNSFPVVPTSQNVIDILNIRTYITEF